VHNCECKHKVVKYCVNCKTIYCKSCKREWYDACTQSHTEWSWTYGNTTDRINVGVGEIYPPLIPPEEPNTASPTYKWDMANLTLPVCQH